jgi:tetratricopeptide (TPR) repeat protein
MSLRPAFRRLGARTRLAPLGAIAAVLPLALGCVLLACTGSSIDSRLEEARTLQDAGQFNESIEPLRAILAESPDLPEANHRLGLALMQTGQPSLAVWPLEKAAKSPDYAVQSGLILTAAFLSINAQEDAIRVASHVLEIDPERAAALRLRVQAYMSAGKQEEALADARRLVELLPEDYQAALILGTSLIQVNKLDEAETVHQRIKELGAASGDPSIAARGCLALANFYQQARKDTARAEKEFEACLATYPSEPLALQLMTQFYDTAKRKEKANELWRKAVAEAPENLSYRMMLAERLAISGKNDEARATLVEAAESFGTPGAWKVLADFDQKQGRTGEALESIERAVALSGGGDDTLRFTQGDLYVEQGQLDKAEETLASLTEPTYKNLLRGRILLKKGDPKGALEAFDAGIRRWPNNAGARYLAGLAARDIGDPDRAISELREAVRADATATDAALVLASLYLERGDYVNANSFSQEHVSKRDPASVSAYVVAARAGVGAKAYHAARETLKSLSEVPGTEAEVALELANVERNEHGAAAAIRVIESSKLDLKNPKYENLLRALVEDLLTEKKAQAALAHADAALAAHPEVASFHDLRGAVLARTGNTADAKAEFEKSLALDPNSSRALSGLASLEVAAGNTDAAIALLERAQKVDEKDPAASYNVAQLLLAQGKTAEAETRLRAVIQRSPSHAASRNDLAWLLANKGTSLDEALSLAEQAQRLTPTADVLDTLGWVQLKRNDAPAAVARFEQALALRPKDPTIRYHLGLALAQMGNTERAVTTLREAVDSGPFPESEAARAEIARLQQPRG